MTDFKISMKKSTKPILHVLAGLPGSGKSTQLDKMIKPETHIVCPDNIRGELYGYGIKGVALKLLVEKEVWEIAHAKVIAFLKLGKNVIFDATNLTKKRRLPLIEMARKHDATVKCVYLNVNPLISLVRNDGRRKHVPPEVILRMFADTEEPMEDEGFDSVEIIESEGTELEWRTFYKNKVKFSGLIDDSKKKFREEIDNKERRLKKLEKIESN